MSFKKIDHWIGKTLFVPPIIKLCQLTRQTQFAVSRLFWFIAALDGFYWADSLFGSVLWGGLSIVMMVSAAWRSDTPTSSFMFFRLLAAFAFIMGLLTSVAASEWSGVEFLDFRFGCRICSYYPNNTTQRSRQAFRKRIEIKLVNNIPEAKDDLLQFMTLVVLTD